MSPVISNRDHMLRAIELAKRCKAEAGKVSPKVGAAVVRDGEVIGEAYRGELAEGDHAEYTLLEKKLRGVSLTGATLFTTLEPCTSRHDPKIPCAQRIIDRGIGKVYIGVIDPNKFVRGDGWWTLREAAIEVDTFEPDLAQRVEQLNHDFTLRHRPVGKRSTAETREPVATGQVGRNGGRIGYLENGDKVEWLPDEDEPGKELALLLRRNDKAILAMYNELWDKVWWNRQQNRLYRIKTGELKLTEVDKRLLESNKKVLAEIEQKYGRENLGWDDFEWGLLSGRMSALAWVMGSDWEESLDT